MYVKFEECKSLVKNIIEIDFLGEDLEKVFMKDPLTQEEEDKPKDNANGEVQDVEVEPTQSFLKDWRYTTSHPKNLILGDVSKVGNYSIQNP